MMRILTVEMRVRGRSLGFELNKISFEAARSASDWLSSPSLP